MSLHVSAATPRSPATFNARDDRVVLVGLGGIRRARPLESNNTAAVFPKKEKEVEPAQFLSFYVARKEPSVERFEKRLALP